MKKMNFKTIKYWALAGVFTLALASCEKGLETTPRQSIDAETALNTADNIDAALVSVYADLKSARLYGRDLVAMPEALSDNGRATNKSGRLLAEAQNIRNAHFVHWSNAYFAIAKINKILEAYPKLTGVSQAKIDAWEGECAFLRAMLYFDLVRAYAYDPGVAVATQDRGGVPLVLTTFSTTTGAASFKPARATVAKVYEQIYKDLNTASTKLGATNTASSGRATGAAARALFSRVALYNKDWATVISNANNVITATGSRLLNPSNYVAGFRSIINPEALFELKFTSSAENIGVNESLQTSYTTLIILGLRTTTAGFGDLVPSNTLLSALGITAPNNGLSTLAITARTSDVRNQLFEEGATGRGAPFVECTKFFGRSGFTNLDNVPLIRVAEIYLNRAEAHYMGAQAGVAGATEAAALADVNTIRVARGLTALSNLTGPALLNEILLQRRLELAFEGHRFFDLKRRGQDLIKGPHYFDVTYTDLRMLPAIPQRELDGNSNLVQNFGY